jgi:hypothetical protein
VGWSSRLFVGFALSYDLVLEKLCLMFWIRLREEVSTIGDFNYRNVGLWHRLQVAGYMVLAGRKFGSGRNSVQQLLTAHQHAPGDTKLELSQQ